MRKDTIHELVEHTKLFAKEMGLHMNLQHHSHMATEFMKVAFDFLLERDFIKSQEKANQPKPTTIRATADSEIIVKTKTKKEEQK